MDATVDSLWGNKQRQGHPWHRVCPFQGSFPPQLPNYFLERFSGKRVLDPFCGRGTVLLEAVQRGREALGFDVLPTAVALSMAKLSCPPKGDILQEIEQLDLSGRAPPRPKMFAHLYHEETWRELWNLREAQKSWALTALCLGRLHGHSPGFFSAFTFNVIAPRPKALQRLMEKHGSELEYRAVKPRLMKAAERFVPEEGVQGMGCVGVADAMTLPLPSASVDLVITSPPFFDVIDYPDVNWVREWFLGADRYQPRVFFCRTVDAYKCFLQDVLRELSRVLRKGGVVVFEVGNTARSEQMSDLVRDVARGCFFLTEVIEKNFSGGSVPKISRAMVGGRETHTVTNQCVILQAPVRRGA